MVSFPDKLRERRIVLFPNGDIIRNLSQQISPCAIEIVTCCHITVRCLLFINYISGVWYCSMDISLFYCLMRIQFQLIFNNK